MKLKLNDFRIWPTKNEYRKQITQNQNDFKFKTDGSFIMSPRISNAVWNYPKQKQEV